MNLLIVVLSVLTSLTAPALEAVWKIGEYIVPVPHGLAEYASFPVMYTWDQGADGKARLSYKLPEDLVTPETPTIVLEQKNNDGGLIKFEGELGEASCRKNSSDLTCFVIYPGFPIDEKAVAGFLDRKYQGAADLALRKDVARIFSADPKGVVNYSGCWGN